MTGLWILLAALIADWWFGDPEQLWRRTGHPVEWMGRWIGWLDVQFNRADVPADVALRNGVLAWAAMVAAGVLAGLVLQALFHAIGVLGWLVEAFVVFALLAQKSLRDHVRAVAEGLRSDGLAGGRAAVARIVGRDPQTLDEAGIVRAATESLAENFCDGVVAPAFWYAILGLPGIIAYKIINTADSMIGHRSARYLHFGRVAARADDVANWLPARLSALLIAAGAAVAISPVAARKSIGTALRDAGLHRSPNAGWPEAAMAGGLDIALGGPRKYPTETVSQAYLNAAGRLALGEDDLGRALELYRAACFTGWALVAIFVLS